MPPEGIINKPHEELLTLEEIVRLVSIFTSLGISKIRLTGGEPLVRRGIVNLVESLASVEGIEEVFLTTNGTLLSFYAEGLKKAGLRRINISLDTLKEDKFKKITRSNSFHRVLEGIDKAKEVGFYPLKLNVVVMKGINEDEIIDFVDFALSQGITLRFIEFMKLNSLWRQDYYMPLGEVRRICAARFSLRMIGKTGPGPAIYYELEKGRVLGFIKTSQDNCKRCNRLRITSTGELKVCLYEAQDFCLRGLLRNGLIDEEIKEIIKSRIEIKEYTSYKNWNSPGVYMSSLGG